MRSSKDSHICIFPSDGTSRIRFTGQDYQVQSQPDASGSPKTYLRAVYGYYNLFCVFVKRKLQGEIIVYCSKLGSPSGIAPAGAFQSATAEGGS